MIKNHKHAEYFNARKDEATILASFEAVKSEINSILNMFLTIKLYFLTVKCSFSISAWRWFGKVERSSIVKFNVTIIHIFTSCCFSSELAKKP